MELCGGDAAALLEALARMCFWQRMRERTCVMRAGISSLQAAQAAARGVRHVGLPLASHREQHVRLHCQFVTGFPKCWPVG